MDPPAKKQKTESNEKNLKLDNFTFERVLMNDTKSKKICVLGKFNKSDDNVIVIMVKPPFSEDATKAILSADTVLKEEFSNDIYSQLSASTKPEHNLIGTQIINPASDMHIMKYTSQKVFLLEETAEDYRKFTLPYIEKTQLSIDWVYNILEHKKEADRILFEDEDKNDGFILLPDLKWDGKQIEDLYITAICHRRDLKSIRDLNNSHLSLLKNMLEKGLETIKTKYGVSREEIRAYFHYFPTYYHLHVHFNHLSNDFGGINAGKAHLLSDVIDNIENVDGEYYRKKTIPVTVRERDPLYKLLVK